MVQYSVGGHWILAFMWMTKDTNCRTPKKKKIKLLRNSQTIITNSLRMMPEKLQLPLSRPKFISVLICKNVKAEPTTGTNFIHKHTEP